jgi:hypothetical protein
LKGTLGKAGKPHGRILGLQPQKHLCKCLKKKGKRERRQRESREKGLGLEVKFEREIVPQGWGGHSEGRMVLGKALWAHLGTPGLEPAARSSRLWAQRV